MYSPFIVFTMGCSYPAPMLCVGMFFFSVQRLSRSSDNRTLIYCGKLISCGLGEFMTRPGLPEFHSTLATVTEEWACN